MTARSDNSNWESKLEAFDRLSVKNLVCSQPLQYDPSEPDRYQSSREEILESLCPPLWSVRDVLNISKMNISDIKTREIDPDDLVEELQQISSKFCKRDRSPVITGHVNMLLDAESFCGRLSLARNQETINNLWRDGVSILLALEVCDPDLETFSRRVNWIMGEAMDPGGKNPQQNPLLPCAFQCMIFCVAERSLRRLLDRENQAGKLEEMLRKGRLILSALQSAADKSIVLQTKYNWLVTSPWLEIGYLYRSDHSLGTKEWVQALDRVFDRLKAELDRDQMRYQDSGFKGECHAPKSFSKALEELLWAIGPKKKENLEYDRRVIELAHCFIWWVYENRDTKNLTNLPSKADLNKCLPEQTDKVNAPYRMGAQHFPRDRSKFYTEAGLNELKKGAGRKRGRRTTSGKGRDFEGPGAGPGSEV